MFELSKKNGKNWEVIEIKIISKVCGLGTVCTPSGLGDHIGKDHIVLYIIPNY